MPELDGIIGWTLSVVEAEEGRLVTAVYSHGKKAKTLKLDEMSDLITFSCDIRTLIPLFEVIRIPFIEQPVELEEIDPQDWHGLIYLNRRYRPELIQKGVDHVAKYLQLTPAEIAFVTLEQAQKTPIAN